MASQRRWVSRTFCTRSGDEASVARPSDDELVRLQRAWEDAWRDFVVVEVDPLVTFKAGLTDQDPLSGCDAVQLGAALASACDVLVAADRRLCAAARHQELKVIDLEEERAS